MALSKVKSSPPIYIEQNTSVQKLKKDLNIGKNIPKIQLIAKGLIALSAAFIVLVSSNGWIQEKGLRFDKATAFALSAMAASVYAVRTIWRIAGQEILHFMTRKKAQYVLNKLERMEMHAFNTTSGSKVMKTYQKEIRLIAQIMNKPADFMDLLNILESNPSRGRDEALLGHFIHWKEGIVACLRHQVDRNPPN